MSDKPKCPVFGCTIPRGIPHEHPAGVSAVMRDPAQPLDAKERGELMHLRMLEIEEMHRKFDEHDKKYRESRAKFEDDQRKIQAVMAELVSVMNAPWHQLAADIRAIPDGIQRDAIVHGTGFSIDGKHIPFSNLWIGMDHEPMPNIEFEPIYGKAPINLDGRHDHHGIQVVTPSAEAHPSFVNSVGRFAFWMIVLAAAVIGLALLSCVTGDQLSRWFS